MKLRFRAVVLASLLVAAGCSSSDTSTGATSAVPSSTPASTPSSTTTTALLPASESSVPEGFEVFDGSADGFTIALPSRWVPIEATGDDIEAILAGMEDSFDPEALEIAEAGLAGGFALFALDVTGDPNVNANAFPRGPLDSVESLEALLPAQMEELFGATVVSLDRVKIAGHESLQLVHEIAFPNGVAEQHQYYVLSDDVGYVFTFTSYDPAADRDTFAAAIETLTLINE